MPGDCDRCYPVPLDGYPGWSRCGRCQTAVCWPTHVAYDQEYRKLDQWPRSMPASDPAA